MQQIRHERTWLELMRVQQPMAHPAGSTGIVTGEQDGCRTALEARCLIFSGGMAGNAIQLSDEYLTSSHLLCRGIPREPFKAGNHRLRHRKQREAPCDVNRQAHNVITCCRQLTCSKLSFVDFIEKLNPRLHKMTVFQECDSEATVISSICRPEKAFIV